MADDQHDNGLGHYAQLVQNVPNTPPSESVTDALRRAAEGVMTIQDITYGSARSPLRIRGQLNLPAERAFKQLRPHFESVGYTPLLSREDGLDVIRALPTIFERSAQRPPWVAIFLLVATVLSVFYIGVQRELYVGVVDAIVYRLTGTISAQIPANLLPTAAEFREALLTGGMYALALLGILGAHEMGHYIVARHYKVQTSLPFFIPLPFRVSILGTLGAVIAMREPAPNRRIQFDIGIAGPLAGLLVAIPVMILGLSLSTVNTTQAFLNDLPTGVETSIIHEGQSLAYLGLKYLVFGQVLPQGSLDVWIHPVAFAAWAGFLVTALNLLPIGQLDGGHVLYGLFGEKANLARIPVIGALALLAVSGSLRDAGVIDLGFGWSGWWLWILMMLFLLRRHAPVLDEITGLDAKRKALGVAALVIFILIFTPTPLVIDAPSVAALLRWLA
jgi:membrane-associated protease RseP (regulator of RpoE activity)